MSKPATIYRINYQAFDPSEDLQIFIDIGDEDNLIDDSDDQTIIELDGASPVDNQSVIDNSEDPFTVIKAQQLTIRFFGTDLVKASTFSSGSDQRWSVHKYKGTTTHTLFKGFLNIEDLSSPFMPAEGNIIELTANDGLGSLKDIPLTDFESENPYGEYSLGELFAFCLSKTGLSLDIYIAFNIKIDGYEIPNLFRMGFLNAKTFEDRIGTCINCYEVIERIIGECGCLFQRQGKWYVMRIDEVISTGTGLFVQRFGPDGVFIEDLGELPFEKTTGIDLDIFFTREATRVINQRSRKSVKTIYNYEYPQEIVDNIDFSRGDLVTTVSPTEKHFKLEDWILLRGYGSAATTPNISAYIQRIYNANGYETDRYLVLTMPPAFAAPTNFVQCNPIHIGDKDKFDLSFDWRFPTDKTGGGNNTYNLGAVRLIGSDGSHWFLDDDGTWYLSDSDWALNLKIFQETWDADDLDETEWRTKSVEAKPAPIDGKLYLELWAQRNVNLPQYETDIYFSNLVFDYHPYVNGSYQKYTGQSQAISQTGDYKAKRENAVYMSESPKKLFKGAIQTPLLYVTVYSGTATFLGSLSQFFVVGYKIDLFRRGQRINITGTASNNQETRVREVSYNSGTNETLVTIEGTTVTETVSATIQEQTYSLANDFYDYARYGGISTDVHPYSEIQIYDLWNQFRNDMRIIDGTLQGLNLAALDSNLIVNEAHLIHNWTHSDITEDTYRRSFILLTFDKDGETAEWRGLYREVHNTDRGKTYSADRVFKYEQ